MNPLWLVIAFVVTAFLPGLVRRFGSRPTVDQLRRDWGRRPDRPFDAALAAEAWTVAGPGTLGDTCTDDHTWSTSTWTMSWRRSTAHARPSDARVSTAAFDWGRGGWTVRSSRSWPSGSAPIPDCASGSG